MTKKITLFSLFFLFFPFSVWAQKSGEDLLCYQYTSVRESAEENQKKCLLERTPEVLAAEKMLSESEAFHQHFLTPLHQDNGSDPHQTAQKSIWELRKHKVCLQQICQEVFSQCDPNQKSLSSTLDSGQWCGQKTKEMVDIAKTNIETITDGNFSRKNRSLTKQKFNALGSRFGAYFQHWMPLDLKWLETFAQSVSVFIAYPF